MTELLVEVLRPILYAVAAAVATIAGYYVKQLGTQAVEWIKGKIGADTYDKAMEVASGLYIYLEDKYGDAFKQMGETKKAEMIAMLKTQFPTLTDTELEAINKTVWLNFQDGFNGTYVKESAVTKALNDANETTETERVDG